MEVESNGNSLALGSPACLGDPCVDQQLALMPWFFQTTWRAFLANRGGRG